MKPCRLGPLVSTGRGEQVYRSLGPLATHYVLFKFSPFPCSLVFEVSRSQGSLLARSLDSYKPCRLIFQVTKLLCLRCCQCDLDSKAPSFQGDQDTQRPILTMLQDASMTMLTLEPCDLGINTPGRLEMLLACQHICQLALICCVLALQGPHVARCRGSKETRFLVKLISGYHRADTIVLPCDIGTWKPRGLDSLADASTRSLVCLRT